MKRRAFIKNIGLASLGMKFLPLLMSASASDQMSLYRIMGIDSSHLASYSNIMLEFETLQAYRQMKEEAARDGIQLQTISGFKSFEYERNIYESEYYSLSRDGYSDIDIFNTITTYAPIPGTSRYHWGTEIDVVDLAIDMPHGYLIDEENYIEDGIFYHLTQWMEQNATKFGFYQPYTNDSYRKGFAFEPWHYSYRPAATKIIKQININALTEKIRQQDIDGLSNIPSSYLPNYLEEYVFGVNKALLFV